MRASRSALSLAGVSFVRTTPENAYIPTWIGTRMDVRTYVCQTDCCRLRREISVSRRRRELYDR